GGKAVFIGGPRGGPGTPDPGQITWPGATLKGLITAAYNVKPYQVNGPSWIENERYDIVAKVPAGATKEQGRVMWQNLLAERLGMKVHHESKEFSVDDLVVARGGPKLKEYVADPNAPPPPAPGTLVPLPPGPPKVDKNGFPELAAPGLIMMINMS